MDGHIITSLVNTTVAAEPLMKMLSENFPNNRFELRVTKDSALYPEVFQIQCKDHEHGWFSNSNEKLMEMQSVAHTFYSSYVNLNLK